MGLFSRRLPEPDETELDEPAYQRRGSEDEQEQGLVWHRTAVQDVRVRPLLWTMTPPQTPGWWFVRFPDKPEYIAVRVEADYEYGRGLMWAGPLPTPVSP